MPSSLRYCISRRLLLCTTLDQSRRHMQLCLPLYHRQGLPCLCNLLSSDTLKQLDVNGTQAMELLPSVARMLPPANAAKVSLSPSRMFCSFNFSSDVWEIFCWKNSNFNSTFIFRSELLLSFAYLINRHFLPLRKNRIEK